MTGEARVNADGEKREYGSISISGDGARQRGGRHTACRRSYRTLTRRREETIMLIGSKRWGETSSSIRGSRAGPGEREVVVKEMESKPVFDPKLYFKPNTIATTCRGRGVRRG